MPKNRKITLIHLAVNIGYAKHSIRPDRDIRVMIDEYKNNKLLCEQKEKI